MNGIKINNRGQALVIVMLLGIVLLILVMSITTSVSKTTNQTNIGYGSQVSFANAQSGIQQAQSAINSGNVSPGNTNCNNSTSCKYTITSQSLSNSNSTKPITARVPKSVTLPISINNVSYSNEEWSDVSSSVVSNGYVYVMGGVGETSVGSSVSFATTNVSYAPINVNGTLGNWNPTTPLPQPRSYASAVTYNGYIYEIAGFDANRNQTNTIYYAQINPNGGLGAWNLTSYLPYNISCATSVEYNGYIYEMGGCWSSAVYYAQINSNGGLGTWTSTSSFSWNTGGGIMLATSVEYNGYIYEIGGQYEELGASVSPNVYYAQINSNGTLGAWAIASSLPQPSYNNTSVAYKGFIYEIGGVNGVVGQGGTFMDNVYYAQINSNGSLGTWLTTTSLPTVPSNTTRAYATSVEYAGYVYEIGGANGPAEIYSGQLNPSGGINNWNTLPNPCYHVCTINNVPTNLTFNISNSIQVKIYYVNNSNPSNATLYSCYFNANANTNYTIPIPGGATVVYMELNSAGTVNYYEGTGGISIPSSSCG